MGDEGADGRRRSHHVGASLRAQWMENAAGAVSPDGQRPALASARLDATMRRMAKVDATHGQIVHALRAAGFSVVDLSRVGGGVPDLLVGGRGHSWLVEAKRPGVADRKRGAVQARTNASQSLFRATWRGCPVIVATSGEEALRAMGAVR